MAVTVVVEHMENVGAIRNYVRDSRIPEIVDFMKRGDNPHNRLFMTSLVEAAQAGQISVEVAASAAGSKSDFERAMRGIE